MKENVSAPREARVGIPHSSCTFYLCIHLEDKQRRSLENTDTTARPIADSNNCDEHTNSSSTYSIGGPCATPVAGNAAIARTALTQAHARSHDAFSLPDEAQQIVFFAPHPLPLSSRPHQFQRTVIIHVLDGPTSVRSSPGRHRQSPQPER